METLAFVLAIIAAFYAGYKYQKVLTSMESLRESLHKKQDVKEVKYTSNTSDSILDPFDIVQQAKYDHERLMRDLNPDD